MNAKSITDNAILVSFDIVNMFPSIDNNKRVVVVKSALDSQINLSPSTECIIEALEICLINNNSTFAGLNFVQTNGTAMGTANCCSYPYLAIQPIDNALIDAQRTILKEIFYFGQYRDDCRTIRTGDVDRIDLLLEVLNSFDENLKFTVEIFLVNHYVLLIWKLLLLTKKLLASVYSKPTDSYLHLDGTRVIQQTV